MTTSDKSTTKKTKKHAPKIDVMKKTSEPAPDIITVGAKSPTTINLFPKFAEIVAATFQSFVADADRSSAANAFNTFVVDVSGDALYDLYLKSFPEGTNPMFVKRTEHDCGCCKNFIRHVGNVVHVDNTGDLHTVWEEAKISAPYPYNVVAEALHNAVITAPIVNLFRVGKNEKSFGNKTTTSQAKTPDGVGVDGANIRMLTWDHFYSGEIPRAFRVDSPDATRGEYRTTVQVFERALIEVTPDAVETVLSLMEANALYRGAEFKPAVEAFQKASREWRALIGASLPNIFVWTHAKGPALAVRKGSSIGQLLWMLSEGTDLDTAVDAYGKMVDPTNYKRTTSLVTPAMVKKAMETIDSLGLEPALERRFARIDDISVNDVLWVDSSVKNMMKAGGIGETLMAHAVKSTATSAKAKAAEDAAEDIKIEDFIARVLPTSTSMELMFRGDLAVNLVSLTAPTLGHGDQPWGLFKWNNDYAWSYGGNVADSISERVKAKGGKVDGALMRFSLAWFNGDDLDIHVYEPMGGHIFFHNRRGYSGGELDVDMNVHHVVRNAVENVAWMRKPPDGAYRIVINNYNKRESVDVGFEVEVENAGKIRHFTYNKAVRNGGDVHVVTVHVKGGVIVRFEEGDPGITTSAISKEKWGLNTETFVKVNAVTYSPNFWKNAVRTVVEGDPGPDGVPTARGVGPLHTFFFLDGAKSDEATRGIYNEFLHPRLEPHRKVFEVIGDKTKCTNVDANGKPIEGQLSGLGFSSTKPATFLVKITNALGKKRLFNVRVGA